LNAPAVMRGSEPLSGAEKAALVLLSLGKEHGAVWRALDETEVTEISRAMTRLRVAPAPAVEAVLESFVAEGADAAAAGAGDQVRDLLSAFLPSARVVALTQEARLPQPVTTWDRLGEVSEALLANYLRTEYPQTVAVILARLRPDHAARVLGALPHGFALECATRMLRMEAARPEAIDRIEETLRVEFVSQLARPGGRDGHEVIADIFNRLEPEAEARLIAGLEQKSRQSADRVRALMFVFEDLVRLDPGGVQTLLRVADREQLALALKGGSELLRRKFYDNMTERAARILKEDMDAIGLARLRDVETSQAAIVEVAKELAARGEIVLARTRADDELVF
jgi:flagellar motor switch protein FliG